jgi:hypothetical protein
MVRIQKYTFSIVVIHSYFVYAMGGGKHTHMHVQLQVVVLFSTSN